MASAITWISIAILVLFLGVGFGVGLYRGLKRSAFSAIFMVLALVLAYFITKPITNAILGASLTIEGTKYTISSYIMETIQSSFNLSNLPTAQGFISKLPAAIVSPVIFMLIGVICAGLFSFIAMIFNRLCFGKRKVDFEKHKPYHAYGGVVGLVQGLILLVFIFAPISSLTNTFSTICANTTEAQVQSLSEGEVKNLNTLGDEIAKVVPKSLREGIEAFNKGPIAKLSGAGGIDNMMFDAMSNFKLDGEKIKFRKDIITIAKIYDESVIVVNNIQNKTYSNIDISKLKENIEIFVENGFFKKVVVETIKDITSNFDQIMQDLKIENIPDDLREIVSNLKTKFETTDVYEYLKKDISKFIEVADEVFSQAIIPSFENVSDKGFVEILKVVERKSSSIKKIAKNILSLNVVKDGISVFGDYANKEISKIFENDKDLEFGLNFDVADTDKLVDNFMLSVDEFLTINEKIKLADLMEGKDAVKVLSSIQDIDATLIQTGKVFDKIRNLDILVLPVVEGEREEAVYVFDNILKLYDFELLGEEVYLTTTATEKTKLSTYELFFTYLSEPVDLAEEFEFTKLDNEDMTMETIIDNLVIGLAEEEDLISKIMIPFYQINVLNLKSLVFDATVDYLNSQAGDLVNFAKLDETGLTDKEKIDLWDGQFKILGQTLSAMSRATITTANGTETYVKYLLSENPDLELLLEEMLADNKLEECLNLIFEGIIFEDLTATIFDEIDNLVGSADFTGVKPTTDLTNLKETKEEVVSVLKQLLESVLNAEEIGYQEIGEILDLLKENAYNNGAKDGVFNNIFANMVWYMTGDVLNGVDYTGHTPHENNADIKQYLAVTDNDEYYSINYAERLAELADAVDFADRLSTALEGKTLTSLDDIETYIDAVAGVIDEMASTNTDQQLADIIENTKEFLENRGESLLEEQDKTNYASTIKDAIETEFSSREDLKNALIALFDVE